jgi:hypothetical protein
MAFLRVNGLRSVEFGTPGPMRIRLNNLIINGNKRATGGLLKEDYMDEGEEIEFVGERLAILDNDEKQIGIMKVTRVEVLEFKDVPTEFALAGVIEVTPIAKASASPIATLLLVRCFMDTLFRKVGRVGRLSFRLPPRFWPLCVNDFISVPPSLWLGLLKSMMLR